ncbi:NAD-binding protein [Candidatus Woesearchaeota archaeon]|nr:NAD-binding protein [Candidatus Woesearchaeota archaeon]
MLKKKELGSNLNERLFVLIGIIVFILLFGTVGFSLTKGVSIKEGFIITIEVLAFSYHGEFEGTSKLIKVFIALFGVIFFWLALWESFDIAIESHILKRFGEGRMAKQIQGLRNHYIICGGGRVGYHIAELLRQNGKKSVIIEKDEFLINQLKKKGFLVFEGDALEEETLKEVNIKSARSLITVLPESEKNILVILTAKELNTKLEVFARSNKEEYVKKMKKAGAHYVVTPEISCAQEIMDLCNNKK